MNCCDEYGNCRQGRDCPIRQQKYEQGDEPGEYLFDVLTVLATVAIAVVVFIGWTR